MADLLVEYCDSRGVALRVDRAGGVIRGIKVLGLNSRNGREYLTEALARAVGLYEGAKVNVNHPKGHPLAPRDYQERIGVIRNVQNRAGEGLFADFHFNPKHYLSEQLVWDAEHAPENVGFSHNVQARTSRQGETVRVEEITRVHSVDLVADPATTRGLFEAADVPGVSASESSAAAEGMALGSVVTAGSEGAAISEQQAGFSETLCQEQAAEIIRLRQEVDRLKAIEAAEARRGLVRTLLSEYQLPDPAAGDASAKAIVSETFLQALVSAPDETVMRRLLEERRRLINCAQQWPNSHHRTERRPISRDQALVDGGARRLDAKSFARAIAN